MSSFVKLLFATSLAAAHIQVALAQGVESCSTGADSADACAVNKPGGLFLHTQFWDTDPVTGPSNSWTIHGLWPDNCNGTYDENCDSSRAYKNITQILNAYGKSELITYMNTYWVSNDGTPESFWEHEWSTHGTCVSTLDTACYTGYQAGQEAADFFQIVVNLFQTRNTYQALANAGITPSSTTTYTSAAISSALQVLHGQAPVLNCVSGSLNQIYYGFHTDGTLQSQKFVAVPAIGSTSTCPATGIKYLPKSGAVTAPPTSTTTKSASQPTSTGGSGGAFAGTGYLNALTSGSQDGCLIGAGTWYSSGTCATYTASQSGSTFTLRSSKGSCGVVNSTLTCGSGVAAATFSSVNGLLAYQGQTTFYSSAKPSGSTQQSVSTSQLAVSVSFQWQSV